MDVFIKGPTVTSTIFVFLTQMYFKFIISSTIWASIYVSIISTLLVAIYQLVAIRLDPFETRNIITTPRCVATCVVTWIFSGATSVLLGHYSSRQVTTIIILLGLIFFITAACYILIYYRVSKVPCMDNVQLQQRKAENKRVLRTFSLILGTSVACWLLPIVFWGMLATGQYNICMHLAQNVMIAVGLCANSIIYCWRLKEFRSICRGRRAGQVDPIV